MKTLCRAALSALVVLMILALPFLIPSAAMLPEALWESTDEEGEEIGLFALMSSARCEETALVELPLDFSAGMKLNPAGFTEDGYQDESITVKLETRKQDDVIWRIAWVEIQSPAQFRTAIAGKKVTSSTTARPSKIAAEKNAVVAMSGDYYSDDPTKTTFEYRMGEVIKATKTRNKTNRLKDILIIDENGDFHLFVKSAGVTDFVKAKTHQIINAFTFGPALVIDGEAAALDKEYGYNPSGKDPRAAIGQTGKLSYVLVIAEGRYGPSVGATHQMVADFMAALGCTQAYNLDGGGTATMVFNNEYYQTGRTEGNERTQSDIIYFASAVDPAAWE